MRFQRKFEKQIPYPRRACEVFISYSSLCSYILFLLSVGGLPSPASNVVHDQAGVEAEKDEPASSGDSGDESGSEPECPSQAPTPSFSRQQDWTLDKNDKEVNNRDHSNDPQASTSATTQEADSSKPMQQPSLAKIMPKLDLPGGAMLYHSSVLAGLEGLGSNLGLGNLAMGYPHSFILGLANQGQEGASSSTQPQFITIPLSMAMAAAAGPTSTNGCPVSASSDDSSELQDLSTGTRK